MSSCILIIREVNAVHAEAMPYVEATSNGATSIGVPGPGPPSSSIKSKEPLMPLKDIMVAATPHSKLIASALSAPDLLLRLSTANAQEAHAPAPPLGTISYGSSITNSFTSTRQCSASSLKISIGLDEDDEEECQAPGTLNEESDLPHPRGSDDSDTGDDNDDDDEGENSFDGSDLAVSPSKAAASNSSPLGRRFHRGNTATLPSNASGKSERSSRSTHLAFSKAGSLSNNDNEFDSTKNIGSSVKLNRGPCPDKSSKPTLTPSAASALLRTVDSNKVPLSGVDLRDSGRDDDSSSREEDDDDDDDDDFSEDNSMAASDDPIANVGKALDRRINTSVAAPQSLLRHRSGDAVDPSSAPDASTSSPALALAKVGTHSLVHFDPLDPTGTGICSPRRSTLAPLSPLRNTLMPLSSSFVSPPVKAGLLSSYNASDNTDKLRSDAISINHGSLSLLAAPLASPRVSSLLPTSAVPAAGPSLVPSPAIRPSPSVVSGSLLSTGRRAVDSTGTSANPLVTHTPPTFSAVAVMQPVASTCRLNSGPGLGNALATHLQKPIDERDKEDENSNLDFDTSSWDEEDEAEDSS